MKFGPVATREAEGAVLAHATVAGTKRLRKGQRLGPDDVALLREAGIEEVVAAVLDAEDLNEDEAARRLAAILVSDNVEARAPATGRVNLHARRAGVFVADRAAIDRFNRVHPSITLATVDHLAAVAEGQMVATVKIIPFAVPAALVEKAIAAAGNSPLVAVNAFSPRRVALIQTELPTIKASVLDKTARITEARLARSGSQIVAERRTPHEEGAVAEAIRALSTDSDMVLVFGASAICDENDVIPAAIRAAGGTVDRVGMPVDPGNLLVIGSLGGRPVMGAPGCARSPKLNGFDWVLDRLAAGMEVTADDIAGMGVGGLLMEIPTRPQPREAPRGNGTPEVWSVLLAAGRSSRMGASNKLLADFGGVPLARRMAERSLASQASGTVAVLGHQADDVTKALQGLALRTSRNPDYATGLASSLKAGIHALPKSAAGALVMLADMPEVTTAALDSLVAAFVKAGGKAIVRATHEGKRGNPVILPRSLFAEVEALQGDTGARQLVETSPLEVIDVEIGEAASLDVDTPEAMHRAGGVLAG